ncbi:MAG: hypothetical protein HY829_01350, partial [Actinobacteria bacterium]|nr:hypothetical protein [Actinomycetota bacterium]
MSEVVAPPTSTSGPTAPAGKNGTGGGGISASKLERFSAGEHFAVDPDAI